MSREPDGALTETECLALTSVYGELCKAHRNISDFRAKLLALLPLATGVGITALKELYEQKETQHHLLAIGLFGALISVALYLYEIRGMHRCQELTHRAGNLEKALGCERYPGAFRNPQDPRPLFLSSRVAAAIIYSATIAVWVYISFCGFEDQQVDLETIRIWGSIGICLLFGISGYFLSKLQRASSSECSDAASEADPSKGAVPTD